MRTNSNRNRHAHNKQTSNGKLFIQIILCVVIVCGFMIFKDTSLPNGKTPSDYAKKILSTTINLPEIIARFSDEVAIPAGAEIVKP